MTKRKRSSDGRAARRRRARRVAAVLAELYPDAACSLAYETTLQLLIATILSAQCTDTLVNRVTPALFARYRDAAAFAAADLDELEALIRPVNYHHTKAKNIIACCRMLVAEHGGQVPGELAKLTALPGVGRKTANVVLGNAFGVPSMVVDTHVARLSQRLGLTTEHTPDKIEQDLRRLLPAEEWVSFGHRLILHGRQVCRAPNPRCADCALASVCPRVGVAPAALPKRPPARRRGTA
jgi:endonuclease-3